MDGTTDPIVAKALENARFHERMLTSGAPDVNHQYHVGAIDAYVAVLKAKDAGRDWLSYIRETANA
jgi:hypothetical protein